MGMTKNGHNALLKSIKFLDVLMLTVPFALCWYLYYADRIADPFYGQKDFLLVFLFLCLYLLFAHIYDGFLVSMMRISEIITAQILAAFIADGIMYIIICILSLRIPNILPGLAALAGQALLASVWAWAAHAWFFRHHPPKKTTIIFDVREGVDELINQYGMDKRYEVVQVCKAEDCVQDLSLIDDMETVFFSGVHSHERNTILKYCIAKDIEALVIPRLGDTIMASAHPLHMLHLPILCVDRYMATPEYLVLKRFFDILLSLLLLILTSPIFLVTAIAIKATDHGPVFYKQTRLTKDGKEFQIIKFRSMRVDAEKDGQAVLSAGEKDDRITPVGRVIRKCRIDELPQFINILKGDLSLVGPRPERPEIAAQYMETLPEFALRLQAKAGLTGYAQVYGKYNTTPYDKLVMDLMYIAKPSIVEDFKIIFATLRVLFLPESTEGIQEGTKTAMPEDQVL